MLTQAQQAYMMCNITFIPELTDMQAIQQAISKLNTVIGEEADNSPDRSAGAKCMVF